jgi:hypothetical protein
VPGVREGVWGTSNPSLDRVIMTRGEVDQFPRRCSVRWSKEMVSDRAVSDEAREARTEAGARRVKWVGHVSRIWRGTSIDQQEVTVYQ